jgi:DNA mismatch endonuclease Vsr
VAVLGGRCGRRIALFMDGAFWHGHPSRYKPGRSGPAWDAKIRRNMQRDREDNEALADMGWHVLRVWISKSGETFAFQHLERYGRSGARRG